MLHLACLNEETAASGCCGIAETKRLTHPKTKGNIRKHSTMTPKNTGEPRTCFPEVPNAAGGKVLERKGIEKQGQEGENAFLSSQTNSKRLSYYISSLVFAREQGPRALSADGQCSCLNHLTAISLISRPGAKLNNKEEALQSWFGGCVSAFHLITFS